MIELAGRANTFFLKNMGIRIVPLQICRWKNSITVQRMRISLSITNGIGSWVGSITKELLDKCPVLEDFKAVKEGNVWCTTDDIYQQDNVNRLSD